jgi:hypothetical protein
MLNQKTFTVHISPSACCPEGRCARLTTARAQMSTTTHCDWQSPDLDAAKRHPPLTSILQPRAVQKAAARLLPERR